MSLPDIKIILEYIASFTAVIFVIVVAHEFGHYLVARLSGVRINVFSVGFGKELFGFTDKHGTRWRLSLLPLGGYVSMYGENPDALKDIPEEEKSRSFMAQPVLKRTLIVAAGPFANFLLALIMLPIVFILMGKPAEPGYATIHSVVTDSAADKAGVKTGDVILKVNNKKVKNFRDIADKVFSNRSKPLAITIERNNEIKTVTVIPKLVINDQGISTYRIGLRSLNLPNEPIHVAEAVILGTEEVWRITYLTTSELYRLIFRDRTTKNLAGPVRIVKLSRDHAASGTAIFLAFISLLSINLGLINLFPLPVLDGGHLVFYGIEALRGKPVSLRLQNILLKIGFVLLITLMVFVTLNDLSSMFQ